MARAVLLGLLGAAALAAVGAVPLDNKKQNEEMVTRCIIEVLSNALSKPSIPTITPECRQVLKKSEKEVNEEEKSENGNTKFEVRLLRDPADAHQPSGPAGVAGQTKADSEQWEGADGPQESVHPNAQVSKEARTHHAEKSQGEERGEERGESPPKSEPGTAAAERLLEEPGEARSSPLDRSTQAARNQEEPVAGAGARPAAGPEKTHSKERAEDPGSPENPQDLSSQEDSAESQEDPSSDVAKRRARPRHHHARSRADRAPPEGTPPSEARGYVLGESREEAGAGPGRAGEKRGRSPARLGASEEEPEYGEEARRHLDLGPRYGGRGNEGARVPRPQNEESQEEGDKRNHPNSALETMANRYSEESEEKRGHEGIKGRRYRARGGGPWMDKAERNPPGSWQEQERSYPNYGEEESPEKWQEDLLYPKDYKEEVRFPDKHPVPPPITEKRKRLGVLINPYFDPRQWKNRDFEKKDDTYDSFPEGEDDSGLTLAEKTFSPEYSYDWWERQPFSEDVNWGYEKRSFARSPHVASKRQYDGVAELDQLLHYRKKSAEFPDFYDSEEEMEQQQHEADQRTLTEEEEKELENLAAMDLELQKIAEKLAQRG